MNSLDEAIAHAKEKAKDFRKFAERIHYGGNDQAACLECAEDHEQLAVWLEELKDYREGKRTCENCKHKNKAENQYPCSNCRCNHANYFEWESEDK